MIETTQGLNNPNIEKSLELMIINTVESIVKLNTKISACLASKLSEDERKAKLEGYDKKLMNLCFILYPGRDFARKILSEKKREYLYILDFVEKRYVSHTEEK